MFSGGAPTLGTGLKEIISPMMPAGNRAAACFEPQLRIRAGNADSSNIRLTGASPQALPSQ
jgi:hypothetical protein